MASVLSPSIHLISGSKFVINAPPPPPPPSCVRFRSSHRVSAVSSTVGRNNSSCIAPSASLYEVLGIQMGATYHEIKTAYRSLARVLHPDVGSSNGRSKSSGEEFMRIQAAYSTLSDAEKRADYDRKLFRTGLQFSKPAALRFSGSTHRRWETDQ